MKMLRRPSPHFIMVVTIILGLTAVVVWFLWAIEQSHAEDIPTRAITAAGHAGCADMPRGSQEMEESRHECFKQLYAGRWVSTDR